MSNFKVGDRVKIIKCEHHQSDDLVGTFSNISYVIGGIVGTVDGWAFLEHELVLADDQFATTEPQPACKQNQDWMLQHLKDIASELENDRDEKWLGET